MPGVLRDAAVGLRLDAFPLDDNALPLVLSATLFPSIAQVLADPTTVLGPPAMQLGVLTAALRSRAGALSLLTVLFSGHESSARMMARPRLEMPGRLSLVAGAPIAPV
jgi:hypothetical protein